jgi:hypothetical protein
MCVVKVKWHEEPNYFTGHIRSVAKLSRWPYIIYMILWLTIFARVYTILNHEDYLWWKYETCKIIHVSTCRQASWLVVKHCLFTLHYERRLDIPVLMYVHHFGMCFSTVYSTKTYPDRMSDVIYRRDTILHIKVCFTHIMHVVFFFKDDRATSCNLLQK